MKKNIDWDLVQKHYDKGNSSKDTAKYFNISEQKISQASKSNFFKYRSKSEARKLAAINKPRKTSEETKKKLSIIRKAYLEAHPDKVPYLLNHSSKGDSYPEKYFESVFKKEGIKLTKKMQVGIYQLDFCDPERLVDVEIDGNQHYYDYKIIESDRIRTAWLEERGWKTIRIRWSDFSKMSMEDRHKTVKNIDNFIQERPLVSIDSVYFKKKQKDFCECGYLKYINSKVCLKCKCENDRKVIRPSAVELEKMLWSEPCTKIAKKFMVSDRTIGKWAKSYNITKPPRGYWKKQQFLNRM